MVAVAVMLSGCPSTNNPQSEPTKGTPVATAHGPGMGPMMSVASDGQPLPTASGYPGMMHGTGASPGPGMIGPGASSTPHGVAPPTAGTR